MKVILLKDARIKHKAGEIVEVSPVDRNYLVSVKLAKDVEEPKKATRKTTKK